MAPRARLLQPVAGRAVPVTAASTFPERSHSEVWSWSSTATSINTGAAAAKAAERATITGSGQVCLVLDINGLTKAMAKEWGRYKVNVNSVAFGLIMTRLTEAAADADAAQPPSPLPGPPGLRV